MPFDHITTVDWKTLSRSQAAVFALTEQGEELCFTGFTSTQEMLAWLDAKEGIEDCITLGGKWEVDDAGSTYDFEGEEVYAGDTWEEFKADHAEFLREEAEAIRTWREEIAREEGMLNGIDSYNDWMGY